MRLGFPVIIGASALLTAGIIFLLPQPPSTPPPSHPDSLDPEMVLSVQQQQGFALVTSYCADCHAVGTTDDSLHPTAPHFRDLHLLYDVSLLDEALVEGLIAHPQMPEFEFDAPQAEAIIQYLKALETH